MIILKQITVNFKLRVQLGFRVRNISELKWNVNWIDNSSLIKIINQDKPSKLNTGAQSVLRLLKFTMYLNSILVQ